MRSKVLGIAAGLMVAGAVTGFSEAAASEYIDSQMLQTESAVPLEEGAVDVELGVTYTKANDGKRGSWSNNWSRSRRESFRMYEWTLAATMGIAPETDITLSTGWVDLYDRGLGQTYTDGGGNHGRGMDDLTVALRHRLLEEGGTSVAYIPGMTIPTGRHSNEGRGRFGPGQKFWSLDQRIALTQDLNEVVLNADVGYSLPFGRTRRSYMRDWGESTEYSTADRRSKDSSERGVLDANAGVVFAEGPVRPLVELNYAHRWISRGNDSDQIHATIGSIIAIEDDLPRVKVGYQHPVAGRNAARTRRFLLSMAYAF